MNVQCPKNKDEIVAKRHLANYNRTLMPPSTYFANNVTFSHCLKNNGECFFKMCFSDLFLAKTKASGFKSSEVHKCQRAYSFQVSRV